MKKMTRTKIKKYPHLASEVPVTQRMPYGVRDELRSEIKGMEAKLSYEIHQVSSEARAVEAKLSSQIHQVSSQVHRLGGLIEEQNSKNNVVLDGLTNLFHRQELLEEEVFRHEKILTGLK
jgi:hypothetical protein